MNNGELAKFCIEKIGTPYVMGTNGKKFTQAMYNDLVRRNPGGWFSAAKLPKVKSCIGQITTDCHGLIEWFVREQSGQSYDTTADAAFQTAKIKGSIKSIPEQPGICVRYSGHVGIYIGGGYVVEARGFDYGVCITKLSGRPWTHWYKHSQVLYTDKQMPAPAKVSKTTSKYSIIWLQLAFNRQIAAGHIKVYPLIVDGIYGSKTAAAVLAYWQHKGWSIAGKKGTSVGSNTIKTLAK